MNLFFLNSFKYVLKDVILILCINGFDSFLAILSVVFLDPLIKKIFDEPILSLFSFPLMLSEIISLAVLAILSVTPGKNLISIIQLKLL